MQPADLVALVSLGDTLKVDQDFTADKNALINEVGVYNGTEGQGFAQGATANSNQVEDTTGYTPDESEYNDINTDRELFALRAVSKSLEKITEKKSLLYFSGGISRDGIENQASLRVGHQRGGARQPGHLQRGHARPAGDLAAGRCIDGQPARHGRLQRRRATNNMNANFASQEVMATLSTRHGRQGVFRLQRFCAGVCAGAERHVGVLRHRISQHQSGARREVSQADHQDQPAGHQA